jgi:hypothetical protein
MRATLWKNSSQQTTKNKRLQVEKWRCRCSNGMRVEWTPPLFLYLQEVGLGAGKLGNLPNLLLRALIAPPEKCGTERSWGRCGHTLGWLIRHCLALVGSWLGLDGPYVDAWPRVGSWMGHLPILWCRIFITLSLMAHFDHTSHVFHEQVL